MTGYGSPDVLAWSEVALPEPGPGQIRIRVQAAGVGPTDLKIRRGDLRAVFPLPAVPVLGFEAAGVVDALGAGVTGVAVGDAVAANLPALGGYGEYALASGPGDLCPRVSLLKSLHGIPCGWSRVVPIAARRPAPGPDTPSTWEYLRRRGG